MSKDFTASRFWRSGLLAAALLGALLGTGTVATHAQALSAQAQSQIASLLNEKQSRTPTQRKMDSQLIYAAKMQQGKAISSAVATLSVSLPKNAAGLVLVDIDGNISHSLLKSISVAGGSVVSSFPKYKTMRALLPLSQIESIAALKSVRFIRPAVEASIEGVPQSEFELHASATQRSLPMVPRAVRAAKLRAGLSRMLAHIQATASPQWNDMQTLGTMGASLSRLAQSNALLLPDFSMRAFDPGGETNTGSVNSQGDATHRANLARTTFGVTGVGIRVGVLSDSIDDTSGSYAAAVTSGDVSPVTVLPGQAGTGAGEGLAMLEIIHDLAPDAQLYFATANGGPATFAQNIRDLRSAGCEVIIDDVGYFNESPFQDDVVSQAVSAVTANGALYFSSSANSGSIRAKTSGTWEGDFNDGGAATGPLAGNAKAYRVHLFTGKDQLSGATLSQPYTAFPAVAPTAGGTRYGELFWSDPLGASTNDYDVFLLNPAGTAVLASSTNSQTGTQDPYELFTVPIDNTNGYINKRFVVVKAASAAARFLHFDTGRGYITIATTGVTRGHSAVPAAFSTAATPASAAADPGVSAGRIAAVTGPYPNAFSSANTTEGFSSDGPRHVFYNVDGTPITPGNLSSTGGTIRPKPDITAADGVNTTLPAASGLNPFYGTSAAAPHAGAIAALLKSYNVSLTSAQVRSILTGPAAIDIDDVGYDIVSGYGIVDAYNALAATTSNPPELLNLVLNPSSVHGGVPSAGTVSIKDPAPAGGTVITLSSASSAASVPASVTIPQGMTSATFPITTAAVTTSQYVNIAASYLTQTRGALLLVQALYNISGHVTTQAGTGVSGVTIDTQTPGDTTPTSLTNTPATPVAIPDYPGPAISVPITFTHSGAVAAISVGINITHTYRGDLQITLISPDGTPVVLKFSSNDSTPNYNTTFPVPTAPDQPLSTLFGKPIAGTWKLQVQDLGAGDVGTVNSFSLTLTPLTTTTDSTGAYSFQNLASSTLTLTPSKAGFNFVPTSRTITLGPDTTGQDFVLSQAGIRTSATVTKGTDYAVTLTFANGGPDAANAQVTRVTLGSAAPTSPAVPTALGTITLGNSTSVTYHFPLSAGASGSNAGLRVAGSYTGGSFSGSLSVTLP